MNKSADDATFRVAAFQGAIREKDAEFNLAKTVKALEWADQRDAHVLAMPESYLHGYFPQREDAWEHSIDLGGSEFADVCSRVSKFNATLLLGLNERRGDELYNTVAVIERGELIGKYSKNFVCFDYFQPGLEFPVFERAGVKYGIIICWDSSFVEPARIAAMRGAQVIFSPHFNRIGIDSVDQHYRRVRSHHISRAAENGCWVVRSNVIWSDEKCAGLGDSFIVNELGEIVCQAGLMNEIILFYAIPKDRLNRGPSHWENCPPGVRDALIAEYAKLPVDSRKGN